MKAVVINDTSYELHHGCSLVMGNLKKLLASSGIEIIDTCSVYDKWNTNRRFMESAQVARIILVNGEGTIHHDRPKGYELLEASLFAEKIGKPIGLINFTYESNDDRAMKILLEKFSIISARDKKSRDEIRSFGFECSWVPDLTFCVPTEIEKVQAAPRASMAYSDSVDGVVNFVLNDSLFARGDFMHLPIFSSTRSRIRDFRALLKDVRVQCRNRGVFASVNDIYRGSRCFFDRVSGLDEYLSLVGSLDFLVAGRFHSLCMSIIANVPFVAIESNTSKNSNLINDIGLRPDRIIGLDDFRNLDFNDFNSFSGEEECAIEDYKEYAMQSSRELLSRIREFSKGANWAPVRRI